MGLLQVRDETSPHAAVSLTQRDDLLDPRWKGKMAWNITPSSSAGQGFVGLVLMDITLAGKLDGITAAVTIRGSSGIPVVFLTAHADDKTMERAMLAGPFGYLIKPFDRGEIKAAIEVALHKHKAERERRE